jgi:hypothetical protein
MVATYLVEAAFPGASNLLPDELDAIACRARRLDAELGTPVRWDRSYLATDRLYLLYRAEGEEHVRKHLDRLGLEPESVTLVSTVLSGHDPGQETIG